MTELQGAHHLVLTSFVGPSFDHDDPIGGSGHEELNVTLFTFLVSRIEYEAPVDASDAGACNRGFERDVGNHQRGRSAGEGDYIGGVDFVVGNHETNDLRFVAEPIGKQRPYGPIDQPAGECFEIARPGLTFKESAGNLSRSISFFSVIYREREEVDAFPWAGSHGRRNQNHGVSLPRNNSAPGLSGQVASF